MKLLGSLLMTLGLVAGLLAASTSYLVPTDRPEASYITSQNDDGTSNYLNIAQPAGGNEKTNVQLDELRAQYDAGQLSAQDFLNQSIELDPVLTVDDDPVASPDTLASITAADIPFIHVKEFGFFRWQHWWVFLLSCAVIFSGAMLVRVAAKAEIQAAVNAEQQAKDDEQGPAQTPAQILTGAKAAINALQQELMGAISEQDMCHTVVQHIALVQSSCMEPFVDMRHRLVGQYGMGGYADIMDTFAAAERQINRAWSAAADGYLAESLAAVEKSLPILDKAIDKVS
jgi:hypothetical protein